MANENLITADQLARGGDDPYRRVELRDVKINGKPGVIYLKPQSAGDVMTYVEATAANDGAPDKKQQAQATFEMVARTVVDKSGKKLFTDGSDPRLKDIPMGAFMQIQSEILDMAGLDGGALLGGKEGNASKGGPGDASPTG